MLLRFRAGFELVAVNERSELIAEVELIEICASPMERFSF